MKNNVKEHTPLSAGVKMDYKIKIEITGKSVNGEADRGCMARLVRFLDYHGDKISIALLLTVYANIIILLGLIIHRGL